MQLFYNPEITQDTSQFTFPKEESKHIIKVLRKKTGDTVNITNGDGWLFTAEIVVPNINKCTAKIIECTLQPNHHYHLHLAVAPTKLNDRYEWFLEKATEIGVDSITPIICDHSERKVVKLDRFHRIIQSAMKQSLNCYLPKLNEAITVKSFISKHTSEYQFIAHCEDTNKTSLKEALKPNTNVTILIGPEGDFSSEEIDLAIQNNFIPVSLGHTRLRTETAAIVACHTVALSNE
ncbi:16S rRNA (uracil(1498)-N(3))-methyltransferase [Tamlana fucoidanivorans]|uniref:Ribosomal RNA small subunit methyltransferase E n=1 Tax=Allotamlana fucoidanivorans TaxID=2583814 RepID=A0A5C4SS20_9FLAO|nr:16S rRNA (uracil(1498)-N(3))-methyltransferase [Tamlana fucoidanivorans]TNJ46629.1 16S rRNA (uracil(1498)-N(3))-methyltransferase [Tamlana fucoidanivorans]